MEKKNIFVIGLNSYELPFYEALEHAEQCIFHTLLTDEDVAGRAFTAPELFERAKRQLTDFKGSIDGIIGCFDFPVSTMISELKRAVGLPSMPLTSYLKCEHKYWSRLEQQASIPESIPRFAVFDPLDDASFDAIPLAYPFWIKPVRSVSSFLGFKIERRDDFERAKSLIEKNIGALSQSYEDFIHYLSVDLPDNIKALPKHYFLAEELMGGRQCTFEGAMKDNSCYVSGFTDTIPMPGETSFFSFQYPSSIPPAVQDRMVCIAERFLQHIAFDNAAFNIEFFWEPEGDIIRLIEINPRMVQDYAFLCQQVDGVSNYQAELNLILGYTPTWNSRKEQSVANIAAMMFYRVDGDAYIEAVPDEKEVAAIEAMLTPGAMLAIPDANTYLSEIKAQDCYNYLVWYVYLGAKSEKVLHETYNTCAALINKKIKLRMCN